MNSSVKRALRQISELAFWPSPVPPHPSRTSKIKM
uniref:Uncharacterized protein n=1 Tax=Arundo donax TaxID=35708 RepID=A0A0A8ZYM9_ARUDO